jgi:hypothetical protein
MTRAQYAQTVSVTAISREYPVIKVSLEILKIVCWLCLSPLFLLGCCITLFYGLTALYWTFAAMTTFQGMIGAVIAISLNLVVALVDFRKLVRPDCRESPADDPGDYSATFIERRSGLGLVVVSVSGFARFSTVALMPGILSLITFFIFAYFPFHSWCPPNFLSIAYLVFFGLFPITLTWCMARQQHSFKFVGRGDRLYRRNDGVWRMVRIADIAQVSVRRSTHVSEQSYDEDDQSQHSIMLANNNGEEVAIDMSPYSVENRRKIFAWMQKRVAAPLISQKAVALFQQKNSPPMNPQQLSAPAAPEEFNFTTMWQSTYNAHIERTNYVPLNAGHELQNGRYKVLAYLNSGGFCTTYLCNNADGHKVVIKESSLPASLPEEARKQVSEMFAREARLLQRCRHPRIARILDFFHENEREYLILEYIDGASLSDIVRRSGPISEKQVVVWLKQMAEFLQHLHELEPPIIHRDFTPQNLLVHRSGDLHLIDFGAANDFIGQATGTLIGKQSYIAPEQLQGKACGQSDIYGLGATVYFLLTGQDPMPLTELHPGNCFNGLRELVADCTKFDKQQRIQSAAELNARLSQLH